LLFFLLIGFSWIYLDVHWLGDVLAGYSLGMLWLTFLILVLNEFMPLSDKTNDSIKPILNYSPYLWNITSGGAESSLMKKEFLKKKEIKKKKKEKLYFQFYSQI